MWIILSWQFGCKDKWSPEFTYKFGWFVNIKSIQKELFVWIWVGSFINWEKLFENVNEYKCDPAIVLMSLPRYEEYLTLKSPVTTDKGGLHLFMSLERFSKLDENNTNWLLFWVGER